MVAKHISEKPFVSEYKKNSKLSVRKQTIQFYIGKRFGYFVKENIWMASKYMKRCLTSLVLRYMQDQNHNER